MILKTIMHRTSGILLLFFSVYSQAGVTDLVFGDQVKTLDVPVGHSRILVVDKHFTNISVGDPRIADVIVLDAKKVYILGKALGSTNVVLWGPVNGVVEHSTINVDVTHDVEAMKKLLHQLMPEEKPEVRSSQGAMVITGEVSSPAKVDAIHRIATQFVNNSKQKSDADKKLKDKDKDDKTSGDEHRSTEVINLMQVGGPHQVMLEVKVAEISRSVLKRMGVNLLAMDNGSKWSFGAVNGGATFPGVGQVSPSTPSISVAGLFGSYLTKSSLFNIVLDATKEDGLAKILAEPTLTTTSGEAASFLSGGEFPLPVWSGENRITVVYKEYGIKMKALPIVLNSKKINIQMDIEVSELSDSTNVAAGIPGADYRYVIPALTSRKTQSTIDLLDGQTIGISGLISDKMREAVSKFPGLGDVPVLGALFRSQEYIQDQTELVMFVTARLAKPVVPSEIQLPTDSFESPSDMEFFLLGSIQGGQTQNRNKKTSSTAVEEKAAPTGPDSSAPPKAVDPVTAPADDSEPAENTLKLPSNSSQTIYGHKLEGLGNDTNL